MKVTTNRKSLNMRADLNSAKAVDDILHRAFKWDHKCPDCDGRGNVIFKSNCCTNQVECDGCEGYGVKNMGQFCETCPEPRDNPDINCVDCGGKGYISA